MIITIKGGQKKELQNVESLNIYLYTTSDGYYEVYKLLEKKEWKKLVLNLDSVNKEKSFKKIELYDYEKMEEEGLIIIGGFNFWNLLAVIETFPYLTLNIAF